LENKLHFLGIAPNYVVENMHSNEAWVSLFRRIPADKHDIIMLGLMNGTEIMIQNILRLEPEFMMLRGRWVGTQDSGRIIMIPYAQLTVAAIAQQLKDTEVDAMSGKDAPAAVTDLPSPPLAEAEPAPSPEAPAEPATVNEPRPAVNPLKRTDSVARSALLAKLRDRLK
jgi:hypothetical protein